MLALYLAYLDEDSDKGLFEEIFNSHKKQMVTLAKSILCNESDAEDAVSEVFLCIAQKNWDAVRSIKDKTDLRNYLLKATKNTAINMINSKNKSNISLDTISEHNVDDMVELSDDTFIELICDKAEYNMVIDAIDSLNEKYRNVLYYHFIMELTVPQTAKAIGLPLATVKKQLVRGKKLLLDILETTGDENNGN
ncbi:MAG: sigma-70 family RNA polymerase sigma factor, partial [Clostridia bacterium]|nr:sigma-70 family RNA polymerase sigma factor [Clostridia bacterium]